MPIMCVVVVVVIHYLLNCLKRENIFVTYNIPDFVVHIDISTHTRVSGA